ncbi:MAG: ArsA family ATPase [Actinobacteria bacterium]|nr:ArsA family ATPase [Actinomycetota bacterium]
MPTGASASAADTGGLFGRRLLFVTGKGGTGKTSVAAAIALAASRTGRRVLLVEMDAKGSLAAMLGTAHTGYDPVVVAPNLSVMSMDTESSLREYLRIHLRIPFMARLAPLAGVFDFVADAAPGVKEILGVGKVAWEVREQAWDLVVVDSEASGHVVSQIASPRVINRLVAGGPLASQTKWMLDILEDPARTGVVVVSTTEELAVTETVSLVDRLRSETGTGLAAVVVNRADTPIDPEITGLVATLDEGGLDADHRGALVVVREAIARAEEARGALADLTVVAGSASVIVIPDLATSDPDEASVVRSIADVLAPSSDTEPM